MSQSQAGGSFCYGRGERDPSEALCDGKGLSPSGWYGTLPLTRSGLEMTESLSQPQLRYSWARRCCDLRVGIIDEAMDRYM